MASRKALVSLLVLHCSLAGASESLVLLDDFIDPSLRGARLCLPPTAHHKNSGLPEQAPSNGPVTNDAAVSAKPEAGCVPTAGPPLTSVDVSAGVVKDLVENLEFLKQDAAYANLGFHHYFEAGSHAIPFDLTLNASAFDAIGGNQARRVRDNIQLRGGLYSLYSSGHPAEVITTRQSLSIQSTSFVRQPSAYLASFDTQLQELDGSGHLMFEYRWGGGEAGDFRIRSYTILTDLLHLTNLVPDSLRGSRGRLQFAVGFGGGVSEGRLHWLPFSGNLHAEYDIGSFGTAYAGAEYAHQPSAAPGLVAGNNVQLQIGFYCIPLRASH